MYAREDGKWVVTTHEEDPTNSRNTGNKSHPFLGVKAAIKILIKRSPKLIFTFIEGDCRIFRLKKLLCLKPVDMIRM